MDCLIISGMSGAGKSRAADILEDLDYYCVDNMPVALLPKFAELCLANGGRYDKVALVTDIRERGSLSQLFDSLKELGSNGLPCRILFMEADTQTLVRRYNESRRPHPLAAPGETVQTAIERERQALLAVRERADFVINTAGLETSALRRRLTALFAQQNERGMSVTVTAFGYKYGLPMDADLVFDVRFLPNPYYVESLRPQSGMDAPVYDYVMGMEQTQRFMEQLGALMTYLTPLYAESGRYVLNIAVGCTGGRHRSVAVARALAELLESPGVSVSLNLRDMDRGQ